MEPEYTNITCRRKKSVRQRLEQYDMPHGQNNYTENEGLNNKLNFERNENEKELYEEEQSTRVSNQDHPLILEQHMCENYEQNSDLIRKSWSRLQSPDTTEQQDYLNKSENIPDFDFDRSINLCGKVKKKGKHKDKFRCSSSVEKDVSLESDSFCNKKKKKNQDIVEEIKLLPENTDYDTVCYPNLSFTQTVKKNKNKNKNKNRLLDNEVILQNAEQDNDTGARNIQINTTKKKKYKNKGEECKHILQNSEEINPDSSTIVYADQMVTEGILDLKLQVPEQNVTANFIECHSVKIKNKNKQKIKLQHTQHGNSESLTYVHSDHIKRKKRHKLKNNKAVPHDNVNQSADLSNKLSKKMKKHKSDLDDIKNKLLTQALEKLKSECVEDTNQRTYGNEISGFYEVKTSNSQQKKFMNTSSNKKSCLYNVHKEYKTNNENLENMRAALISSALKSVGYKKFESNNIHVSNRKSSNTGHKSVEEYQSSSNKKLERKNKSKDRHKIKDKFINEYTLGLNKESSNALNNKDDLRKALITAALKRIEGSEQKQRVKVSSPDSIEHEAKPIRKIESKTNMKNSVKGKNNDIENMRSRLISTALANVNRKVH